MTTAIEGPAELLTGLRKDGFRLRLGEDGQPRISGGKIGPELKAKLERCRNGIIRLLRKEAQQDGPLPSMLEWRVGPVVLVTIYANRDGLRPIPEWQTRNVVPVGATAWRRVDGAWRPLAELPAHWGVKTDAQASPKPAGA
ncbi:MAG: hypothetical protein K2R98_28315 [Gemmataceae bacterium]|nr:hypothetical protein [Gemmataceae bacterium]